MIRLSKDGQAGTRTSQNDFQAMFQLLRAEVISPCNRCSSRFSAAHCGLLEDSDVVPVVSLIDHDCLLCLVELEGRLQFSFASTRLVRNASAPNRDGPCRDLYPEGARLAHGAR